MTMRLKVFLQRHWEDYNQSTGSLYVLDTKGQPIYVQPCIERGDRNNAQGESNCPPGTYPLVWERSPKYGMVWELKNVPDGRSELKIHPANYWNQLKGCIAPGEFMARINGDGYYDVGASRKALTRFHNIMKPMQNVGTTITIIDPPR